MEEKLLDSNINKSYEMVDHPSHYKDNTISCDVETVDKEGRIWGLFGKLLWCVQTAFKYRDRMGNKPGNPLEQEMGKVNMYTQFAKMTQRDIDNLSEEERVKELLKLGIFNEEETKKLKELL